MRTAVALWIVLGAAGLARGGLAATAVTAPDASHYALLADRLFDAGHYRTAALDYERAHALADDAERPELALKLARARYRAGDFAEGLDALAGELSAPESGPCRAQADAAARRVCLALRYERIRLLLRVQDYANAEALLAELAPERAPGDDDAASSERLADLRHLAAFNALNRGDFDEGARRFASLVGAETAAWHRERAAAVHAELVARPTRSPSPTTAALLSILPGAGQAYSGHYAEGVAALALNAALGYMAADSLRKSREIEGYGQSAPLAWSALFLAFYTGNIYSAAQLAEDAGRQRADETRGRAAAWGYAAILER